MGHITIKDLALQSGLSKSTVSRALANDINVSASTRKKVQELARQLGYTRNELAVDFTHRRSHTIGVVVPEIVTPFFINVINSIQQSLYAKGYKVIITQSDENPDIELHNLRMLESYRVDGIIACVCREDKNMEEYRRLQDSGIPVVFFNRTPGKMEVTKVVTDDYIKSFFVVEHLIRQGRRKIVHLTGLPWIPTSSDRLRGYRDALEKFRLPCDSELIIHCPDIRISDGYRKMESFLPAHKDIDAVFGFTDTLAIGAMKYLQKAGVRIPDQVAVAGFSGTLLATLVSPALTTVVQPLDEMGRTAAQLLLDKITNPALPDKTVELKAEIVVRQSTDKEALEELY